MKLKSFLFLSIFFVFAPFGYSDEDNSNTLEGKILRQRDRVREFRELNEMANARNLRVFLFGGTASSFAHYVRWDDERSKGATDFLSGRFDYDYTNIFRSNQDLDLVITRSDGTPESTEEIREFQEAVQRRFEYFKGNHSAWEIRGLKTPNGGKEALENSPDFLLQNSDSSSTGLIELTDGVGPKVRDLRDSNSKPPRFLSDVADKKIHYYRSPAHFQTARAKDGRNPEILSAIRFLIKMFQFGLTPDAESEKAIKAVIEAFQPQSVSGGYVKEWIEKNGKKLFQNAVDLEQAWDKIESLGLRKKLIALNQNPDELGSLSWWMSKEPLRQRKNQVSLEAHMRTAGELGISVVAHETMNWDAYEAITNSPTGKPNLFVSRKFQTGEAAAFGDGFYTAIGKKGARGSGFHIRFSVDPNAIENVDFEVHGTFILWKTGNALRIVPDSLNVDPIEALTFLSKQEMHDEKGIRKRLRDRFIQRGLSKDEIHQVQEFASTVLNGREIVNPQDSRLHTLRLIHELFPMVPESEKVIDKLIEMAKRPDPRDRILALRALTEIPKPSPRVIERVIYGLSDSDSHVVVNTMSSIRDHGYQIPDYHKKIVDLLLTSGNSSIETTAGYVIPVLGIKDPELVQRLIGGLDHFAGTVRAASATALTIYGPGREDAKQKLVEKLKDGDIRVKMAALKALEWTQFTDIELSDLISIIRHKNDPYQHSHPSYENYLAFETLLRFGIKNPNTVREIEKALRRESELPPADRDWLSLSYLTILLMNTDSPSAFAKEMLIKRLSDERVVETADKLLESAARHMASDADFARKAAAVILSPHDFIGDRKEAKRKLASILPCQWANSILSHLP